MTMIINRELFFIDPVTSVIPNEGAAKIIEPRTPQEWQVLRWELEHFVCEGEYHRGLQEILKAYLTHLAQPQQPAVWVSGFYGSGKSHLVRVLEYLWRDVEFPDGARARGLGKLPDEIKADLKELTIAGRRNGGLFSAAGTLNAGAGPSARLATLGILFRSAGLPDQYPLARLVIWLQQGGYYDMVRADLAAQERDLDRELRNMYVSPFLARALFKAVPEFAASPTEIGARLMAQYPTVADITDDELVHTMEDVLELQSSARGKLPCTLLVFDELQQYIGQDNDRAKQVQDVVETCSARFGSLVLFVATGQAALQSTPQLSRLQGRFTVRVTLSDTDVEQVTREVVLRKAPDKVPALKGVLDKVVGEIDRHLTATKIGPTISDHADLVRDYPLLPTRRRFWERVLRALDVSGTASQVRTQLQIVHDATRDVAEKPLGWVVAGDVIYEQLRGSMTMSGVLLREIAQVIAEQDDGTTDGKLRSRLCATAFLIGKLPTGGPLATGLRATVDNVSDLLVEDLTTGSAALRQRVPELLAQLVESGTLMLVEGEYRLQTRESAQWEQDYRLRYNRIVNDDSRVSSDRTTELKSAVSAALKGFALTQGASKTPRKIELCFGPDSPQASGAVPVWVRDEWSASEKTFRQDAQAAGVDSPVVFVFLPKRDPDALRTKLASYAAAKETLDAKGAQTTPEGIEARQAMDSRCQIERGALDTLIGNVLKDARVLQGGGGEVVESSLAASVKTASDAALVRLFPKFSVVDNSNWGTVVKRAGEGAGDALSAVGYTNDAEKHAACQEVRPFLGTAGKKGSEVRKHFEGDDFGWPRDSVDGTLLVLVANGFARAARNGQPLTVKEIAQSQIGVTDFYSEGTVVTGIQRIGVRKLATDFGLPCKAGEEPSCVPSILQRLSDLADDAGDGAPLPERPSKTMIKQLQELAGNEQLVAVYQERDQLLDDFRDWSKAKEKIAQRLPEWEKLQRLLQHAGGLPVGAEMKPQVDALKSQRALLTDPDPVAPLSSKLAAALRSELKAARQHALEVHEQELAALEASEEWQKITGQQRQAVLGANDLGAISALDVGTEEALLRSLDVTSPGDWRDKAEVLPARAQKARQAAAKLLEPTAVKVTPSPATLRSADEVDAYLENLRAEIMRHVGASPRRPVII